MAPWLVTWEASDPSLLPERRVAAVLRGQYSGRTVRETVERLYASLVYTADELVKYGLRPADNPHPAKFTRVRGVPWEGEITCGHNPYLRARLVDRLRSVSREDGRTAVVWDERPPPDFHFE